MIKPIRITHESLDRREALLLASLECTARNLNVGPEAFRAAKAACAQHFEAIDAQRIELLATVK
jgi:hypothetical protein